MLGTLVIQGLTLKPLLHALDLHDGDPVRREVHTARTRALEAGLASFATDRSPAARMARQEFATLLRDPPSNADGSGGTLAAHRDLRRSALQAARDAVLEMRTAQEIGDDAFHQIEEELDWLEMAGAGDED